MRTRTSWQRGERHPKAKLTDEQVRAIDLALRQGASPRALAETYGVARNAVANINSGLTWWHVTGRKRRMP